MVTLRKPVDLCDEDVIEDDDLCVGPLSAVPVKERHSAPQRPPLGNSTSFKGPTTTDNSILAAAGVTHKRASASNPPVGGPPGLPIPGQRSSATGHVTAPGGMSSGVGPNGFGRVIATASKPAPSAQRHARNSAPSGGAMFPPGMGGGAAATSYAVQGTGGYDDVSSSMPNRMDSIISRMQGDILGSESEGSNSSHHGQAYRSAAVSAQQSSSLGPPPRAPSFGQSASYGGASAYGAAPGGSMACVHGPGSTPWHSAGGAYAGGPGLPGTGSEAPAHGRALYRKNSNGDGSTGSPTVVAVHVKGKGSADGRPPLAHPASLAAAASSSEGPRAMGAYDGGGLTTAKSIRGSLEGAGAAIADAALRAGTGALVAPEFNNPQQHHQQQARYEGSAAYAAEPGASSAGGAPVAGQHGVDRRHGASESGAGSASGGGASSNGGASHKGGGLRALFSRPSSAKRKSELGAPQPAQPQAPQRESDAGAGAEPTEVAVAGGAAAAAAAGGAAAAPARPKSGLLKRTASALVGWAH